MSDFKLISPLLDQFDMGEPISSHNGVSCCPAMKKGTNERYIVKIINIPASQTQLDALLLTGAYPDEASALRYFEELAKDAEAEIQTLQKLSRLEGFLPYEDWQVVKMEDAVGYQVYLLGTYKRTLSKQMVREPMTHLNAINLGLDLCAALAVCRRSGYLFVDLKPSNVYVTQDKEFRVGDIGFARLDSLSYASLPDKYRSSYTAPELGDPFMPLNETIDTYAVGLILYQVYNNGNLPEIDDSGVLPPPEYADYEMAEIILKACATKPEDRWQDPVDMGHALVSYMQRNGANDTPIVPPATITVEDIIETVNAITEEPAAETEASMSADEAGEPEELIQTPVSDDVVADFAEPVEQPNETDFANADITGIEEITGDPELRFLDNITDETDPGNLSEDVSYTEVSDELSEILTQVDELTSHIVPEPAVAPDPIEIAIPEPIAEEPETLEEESPLHEDVELPENFEPLDPPTTVTIENDEVPDEIPPELPDNTEKKKSYGWLIGIILALALIAVAAACFLYYQYFYLLPIKSIQLTGTEDSLEVLVDANDDASLKVICSDSHGNQITMPVTNGKATFENLVPNTAYNIKIVADGFHKLTGDTATAYSTPAQTNIVQFNAVTGSEDGSAIIGFTVEGPDDGQWSVIYSAEGEAEQIMSFSSHIATITGLTVGKEYTFRLASDSNLYLTGLDTITFTASKLIYAEDVVVTSFVGGKLTVTWNDPVDSDVENWTVRCYNETDYNETVITSENTAVFEDLDHSQNYTVEVTAAGMSVSQRAFVAKNALTASNFKTDNSDPNKLSITWEVGSATTSDDWLMLYTVDGSEKQSSVPCDSNGAVINNIVPGAVYDIALQDASGAPVLCEPFSYTMPEAKPFTGYNVTAENMSFRMYKAPDIEYTTDFTTKDSIYLKINLNKSTYSSDDKITILFVTRNEDGKVINNSSTTLTWSDIWTYGESILAIPYTPDTEGTYHSCIYFNGQFITDQVYTVKNAAD